jgi:hypothetical protein
MLGQQMLDFTSEDDTKAFEGWLKSQVRHTILALDQLEMWRGMYEECRLSSSVGLMNLKPLRPGEIPIRRSASRWSRLVADVVGSARPKGDVYLMVPRADREWDPSGKILTTHSHRW